MEVTDYSIDFITKMMLVSAICLFAVNKESTLIKSDRFNGLQERDMIFYNQD